MILQGLIIADVFKRIHHRQQSGHRIRQEFKDFVLARGREIILKPKAQPVWIARASRRCRKSTRTVASALSAGLIGNPKAPNAPAAGDEKLANVLRGPSKDPAFEQTGQLHPPQRLDRVQRRCTFGGVDPKYQPRGHREQHRHHRSPESDRRLAPGKPTDQRRRTEPNHRAQ